jgi:hypothetical protein
MRYCSTGTPKVPMIQRANLVLYPIAKGGCDSHYWPYRMLQEGNKLIDRFFASDQILVRGIS